MSIEETIEGCLKASLSPIHLEVTNESYMHSVPAGSESHFNIVVVCESFDGKPLIARHRVVNALVDMSALGIHALALHTFTPGEWEQNNTVTQSPDCHGGTGK